MKAILLLIFSVSLVIFLGLVGALVIGSDKERRDEQFKWECQNVYYGNIVISPVTGRLFCVKKTN